MLSKTNFKCLYKNYIHVFLYLSSVIITILISGALYYIFTVFDPTNSILLTFIKKKLKNWKLKMSVNSLKHVKLFLKFFGVKEMFF